MEKFKNKFIYVFLAVFICLTFVFVNFNKSSYTLISNADNVEENSNDDSISHSLFIHSPTYSILYHQKVYFIDDYDNLLKIYNVTNNNFDTNYFDLTSNGIININTVTYLDEYMIIFSQTSDSKAQLSIINLPDLSLEKQILLEDINSNFNQISITIIENYYLVALTYSNNNVNPIIVTLDQSFELKNQCEISLNDAILETLFKVNVIQSTGVNNDIYLTIVYNDEICFFGTTIENITENQTFNVDTDKSSLTEKLETTNSNVSYSAVNTIKIDDKTLFLITYSEINLESEQEIKSISSKLYDFAVDVSDDLKYFTSKLSIQTNNENYILTSNQCMVYPINENQTINCTTITYDQSAQKYSDNTLPPITNPSVEIEYYSESQFKYMSANKTTKLLSTPWQSPSLSLVEIDITESSKDLIVIGYGKIAKTDTIIEDYKFCLFTNENGNYKGFVKAEDLTQKESISILNYEYKIFKVQPNTNLYSLPTTHLGDQVTDSLTSVVTHIIQENSRVEVINAICRYKSNEKIMLKVKVNNQYEGYIEYDKIIKPSEKINFIITNASIKDDNTEIYLNSDSSSPIIYTLEKGYRVRINGSRNTETGYTSITFNDEYGNEFSGYIMTDSVNSDSWTALQIIGCILIAINIGLLILILKFKHKHIGAIGSKYIDKSK